MIEQIDNHRAKACEKCGSVNFALLKSRLIECNQCGEPVGAWTDAQPDKKVAGHGSDEYMRKLQEKAFNEELMREYIEKNLQTLNLTALNNKINIPAINNNECNEID